LPRQILDIGLSATLPPKRLSERADTLMARGCPAPRASAVLLCDGELITPRDLPADVLARRPIGRPGEPARGDRFEIPPEGINFDNLERDLIMQAMEKADGVIAKAAKMLGMSYRTLQYRLEKFGVKKEGRALEP
jgi:DNA-binding NtrC family response regulator